MAQRKKNGNIKFELVEPNEPVKKISAKGKTNLEKNKKLSQYKQDKPIQLVLSNISF